MSNSKKLFVTVGTTQFDSLIKEITSRKVLETLATLGFSDVRLQIGKGQCEPPIDDDNPNLPSVSYFRLKNSIADDIASADLVISHAGAGSVCDILSAQRPLLVVINEELMGNHQTELAEKLASEGHLYFCRVSDLLPSLQTLNWGELLPFPAGEPKRFADYLDKALGFV